MHKKGIVNVIALLVISLLAIVAVTTAAVRSEKKTIETAGLVLSSSNTEDSNSSGSGSFESHESEDQEHDEDKSDTKIDLSVSGSSGSFKFKSNSAGTETEVETSENKTKLKIKSTSGEFESEVEDGKEKTKLRIGNYKIEVRIEGGKVVTKIKNEKDEEVELDDEEENELLEEFENGLKDDEIEFSSSSDQPGFIQKGNKVRTNFPLSVNPITGELFITTPAGEKVVTILPDVAIGNIIRAGVLTRVADSDPSPSPQPPPTTDSAQIDEGTSSASVAGAAIELTTVNNEPVYEIRGVKSEHFVGLIPIDIRIKTIVSAQNGSLLDIQQGIISRLLDLISF